MKAIFSLLVISSGLLGAATVSTPFVTTFDGLSDSSTITPFIEANSGTANSEFFGGNLRQIISGTGTANSSASLETVAGTVSSAGGFTTSTTFTLDAYTLATGVVNVSLSANGTNVDLGAGSAYRLIYTLSNTTGPGAGALSLQETGSLPGLTANAGSSLVTTTGIAPGTAGSQAFTLTLLGLYTNGGSSISLTGTLTNGTTTLTIAATDTSPTTGNFFGVRSALNGNAGTGSSETVTFTNYSLATIPEPASLAILGASIGLFGLRRKRA